MLSRKSFKRVFRFFTGKKKHEKSEGINACLLIVKLRFALASIRLYGQERKRLFLRVKGSIYFTFSSNVGPINKLIFLGDISNLAIFSDQKYLFWYSLDFFKSFS